MTTTQPQEWSPLDNAAKIFPPTSTARDPKVFRFVCELKEPVQQVFLQRAAERTLCDFPGFRYTLRQGLFWYYLEDTDLTPSVTEESEMPCRALYEDANSVLFRITYYRCRINVEAFHVLSDGTGALHFLRTLVCHYLRFAHPKELESADLTLDFKASAFQKMHDSFDRYYTGKRKRVKKDPLAYRLHGLRLPVGTMRVTSGDVPVDQLVRLAHEHHATITAYLAAVFLCAICDDTPIRLRKRPIVVTIPVNLRNFFASGTARNFFSIINVGYSFTAQPYDFEDVLQSVTKQLQERVTREYLQNRLNLLGAIEHNPLCRICPLPLKTLILRVSGKIANSLATVSFSNIGRVTMPEALAPYIDRFDVFITTSGLQICSCSYGNHMALSFASALDSTDIERRFFTTLTDAGLPVTISTNLPAMEN